MLFAQRHHPSPSFSHLGIRGAGYIHQTHLPCCTLWLMLLLIKEILGKLKVRKERGDCIPSFMHFIVYLFWEWGSTDWHLKPPYYHSYFPQFRGSLSPPEWCPSLRICGFVMFGVLLWFISWCSIYRCMFTHLWLHLLVQCL